MTKSRTKEVDRTIRKIGQFIEKESLHQMIAGMKTKEEDEFVSDLYRRFLKTELEGG